MMASGHRDLCGPAAAKFGANQIPKLIKDLSHGQKQRTGPNFKRESVKCFSKSLSLSH